MIIALASLFSLASCKSFPDLMETAKPVAKDPLNCRDWPGEFRFSVDTTYVPIDPNMNRILKELEKLKNMDVMRKIIDDLNVAHKNLSNEKNEIYIDKIRYNWLASQTINYLETLSESINIGEDKNIDEEKRCMIQLLRFSNNTLNNYIGFIVENFEVKLFNTLKKVELKKMILNDEVKDFLKAKDDQNEYKQKLEKIADDLSEEIRNVYQFLRHEFLFINDWKNWVEEVEEELTRPDDAFKAMIDNGSCDSNVFNYTLNKMINASDSYQNNQISKLFLKKPSSI